MQTTQFNTGQMVKVSCPVYGNGKTFTGIITGTKNNCFMVRISGNKKSTAFAAVWLKTIDLSKIPVEYGKENKAWSEIGYNV